MPLFKRNAGRGARTMRSGAVAAEANTAEQPTYRRNRTLAGHQAVIDATSARSHAHRLRAKRRRLFSLLFGVSLGLVIVLLLLSQFTASSSVLGSGTAMVRSIDAPAYEKLFDDYFTAHPLERFRFATNLDRLRTEVQKSAPEVAGITVHGFAGLGKAEYQLSLRQPMAGWVIGDTQYYVDAAGVTFEKNYFAAPTVQIVDNSGASSQGKAVASKRLLSFVGRTVSLATAKSLSVAKIEIPEGATRTVYVHIEGAPVVYMTIDGGVEQQIDDMAAALKALAARGEAPSYIDVRVPGRAFYK